jgi:hypothetical protein
MKSTPEPGIYRDVPEPDYRAWHGKSVSALKIAHRSLASYRYALTHPTEPTAAMELGTAVHVAVLEPDRFAAEYVGAPQIDRRTKVGKATWAQFQMDNAGKSVLSAADFETCVEMSQSCWLHPLASALLKGAGSNELSLVWDDEHTGMRCKGRIDRVTEFDGWTHVVDLKTCQDASREGFSKAIANYNYHWPHYLDGLNTLRPAERQMTFIAVEKTPPYLVAVYVLNRWAIEQGRDELRDVMTRIAEAEKTDVWPGYPSEMIDIELPRWRQRSIEEW